MIFDFRKENSSATTKRAATLHTGRARSKTAYWAWASYAIGKAFIFIISILLPTTTIKSVAHFCQESN